MPKIKKLFTKKADQLSAIASTGQLVFFYDSAKTKQMLSLQKNYHLITQPQNLWHPKHEHHH
jgi:hypothetical protein